MNQFFLSFMVPVVIELSSESKNQSSCRPSFYILTDHLFIASYPVHDATSNSIMWQGCQTFGFLFVLAMDKMRDANGTPKNNMYRALILQAAIAGLMMVLSFGFRGRMLRSEAMAKLRQEETNEKTIVNEESNNTTCTCHHDEELDLERVSI